MSDTVLPAEVAPSPKAGLAVPGRAVGQGMRALVAEGAAGPPRLSRLVGVIDSLAGLIAMNFRTISRGAADARPGEPKPVAFAEFVDSIPPGALTAVLRVGPWNGPCLAVIGRDLADDAIGFLLGGRTSIAPPRTAGTPPGGGNLARTNRDPVSASGHEAGPGSEPETALGNDPDAAVEAAAGSKSGLEPGNALAANPGPGSEKTAGSRNAPGTAGAPTPRDHTAIERTVLERFARDLIAGNLARSLAQIADLGVGLDRMATETADAAIAKPRAPCLTWRIAVTVEGRESAINFLLPFASIEPIRALLARDPSGPGPGRDPAWHTHLAAELPRVGMTLRAVIERRRVGAAEVLRWRVGSTVVLNHRQDEPVEIFCDDLLVLRARMADQDGRIALHVDERRLADDWPIQT